MKRHHESQKLQDVNVQNGKVPDATTQVKYSECTLSFSRINQRITKNNSVVLRHMGETEVLSTKHLKRIFNILRSVITSK